MTRLRRAIAPLTLALWPGLAGPSAAQPAEPLPRFVSSGYEAGDSGERVRLLVDGLEPVAEFETRTAATDVEISFETRCEIGEAGDGSELRVALALDDAPVAPVTSPVLCAGDRAGWQRGSVAFRVEDLPAGFHALTLDVHLGGSTGFFRVRGKRLGLRALAPRVETAALPPTAAHVTP